MTLKGDLKLKSNQMLEVARLYRDGWSAQQLAYRFDVCKSTVQEALVLMGVPTRTANEGRVAARQSTYRAWMAERRRPPTPLAQALNAWRTQ